MDRGGGPLFAGIDLGTSAVKVVIVDARGREFARAEAACRTWEPEPSRQEQNPEEVWQSARDATRAAAAKVDAGRIAAVCFSTAMHGLMLVDSKDRPLTRMLTWADGRSREQALQLDREQGESIHAHTGCPAAALYYPARLLWFAEHEPALFKKAARLVSIKDFIVHRLTGRWVVDRSNASSNGLLDVHTLQWDQALLERTGISADQLPELVDPDQATGELLPGPAAELGLAAGTMAAPGAGDGGLANLGAGAVEPGQAAATIGTSGAMRKILDRPWLHPGRKAWCYYLADQRWYAGGAINSGGIVMRWLTDGLLSDVRDAASSRGTEPYEAIIELAMQAGPGAAGLMFLPYIFGERTPYWNPAARGVLFGLGPRHGKPQLARAVLEGICMAMAHLGEILGASPGGIGEMRVTGGFTRSRDWVQLLADVIGTPAALPAARENSALGAAILGMKAAGAIQSLAEAGSMVPVEKVFQPDPANSALYKERFELFKNLYDHLADDFERLA